MFDDSRAFVTRAFLRAELDIEYRAYAAGGTDEALLQRLRDWDSRLQLSETQAEGAFTQTFFVDTWGYGQTGHGAQDDHTIIPQFRIPGEGAGGGSGAADLALGWFRGRIDETPQVLCEYKDIRSKLDARQNRKGSNRTPVEQCLNYVRGARRGMFGNEPVQPWWGLVTDMNEFRLYWWDRAPSEYLRFVIRRGHDLFEEEYDLLSGREDARFDRFLFWKLFQRDFLLSPAGRPPLLRLIERQWVKERKLEGEFYERYKAVRERLFNVMQVNNRDFEGTPAELLRLSQTLLDRFIFVFYCEDMGERMLFPPQMIRDHLKTRSKEEYYDPNGPEIWEWFKRLFSFLSTGGKWGRMDVPHINGGLFASDPRIENLSLPNHVFAAPGQGANEAALESDPDTLLYLSGRYNYASRGRGKESLNLYTLGRIFEQSITELEYREGELEGRPTVAKLSKRKRDGVYYTPEWVVNLLVEQTLGPWFEEARAAAGYPDPEDGAPDRVQAESYVERLRAMRIVDPACGSGAFLISAFRRLLKERIAAQRDVERATGRAGAAAADETKLIADILANNIYGVDINPASVEIAKLALWLHSARAGAPLSALDRTIRCGNSLVGPDYWTGRKADAAARERIRAFDWKTAFPEVWPEGAEGGPGSGSGAGFDIVLGNPPYVKLQNLKKADPGTAAWLQADRGGDSYVSAQTGNFDLYLPFIEKGLRLLGPGGRMAYIAPSLWTVNKYGEGLRRLVRRTRQLGRWVDFKAHQVFQEAITYTALQFFTKEPQEALRIATAPEGETQAHDADWSDEDLIVPYATMPEDGEWLMATGEDRALIGRLARDCLRLDDPSLTTAIFQGLVTSADWIYHLERLGTGRYLCTPRDGAPKRGIAHTPPYEVAIEDAIMKPLVSGAEAKRYEKPDTVTYLLFPYEPDEKSVTKLIGASTFKARYPKAWAYLKSWEKELRGREKGKMDRPHDWWGYVYPKSLGRHALPKLIVPRLVEHLKCYFDKSDEFHLDNVDVGGVSLKDTKQGDYLNGVLNGPVADFVFRAIAKPFRGDYRSANKQFIAPLPIPDASPKDRADIAARARELQRRWTARRDLLSAAEDRLSVLARAKHPARWLWPDLPDLPETIEAAPKALKLTAERRKWAEERLDGMEAAKIEALQAALDSGGRLEARFGDGELTLTAGGAPVLSRIYLDGPAGRLAEAYWRLLLLSGATRDAKTLAGQLRRPPAGEDSAAARQFIERVDALAGETSAIEAGEKEMNEALFRLYDLTPDERELVENGRV